MNVGDKYTFYLNNGLYVEGETYSTSIYLSRDGGSTYDPTPLATIANDPDPETILEFEWTVTGPAAPSCKIKTVDSSDGEEVIGNPFEITNIIEVALTVTRDLAVSNTGRAAINAAMSLEKSNTLLSGGPCSGGGDMSLAKLLIELLNASSASVSVVSLAKSQQITPAGIASTGGLLSIAQSVVATLNASASGSGLLIMARQVGISEAALSDAIAQATLALLLGISALTGNDLNVSVGLDLTKSFDSEASAAASASIQTQILCALINVASAQVSGNLALDNIRVINQSGASSMQAAIELAISGGMTTIVGLSIEGAVSFNRASMIGSTAAAIAAARVELLRQLAFIAIAEAVAAAGLNLAAIKSVTIDGIKINVTLQTPDDRIITIEIDNRIITMDIDNRTIN